MNHLDVTAFWEVLTPNLVSVPLPENEDTTLRPPTEREAPITEKYEYDKEWSQAPFAGTATKIPGQKLGRWIKLTRRKQPLTGADWRDDPKPWIDGGQTQISVRSMALTSTATRWIGSMI